MPKPLLTNLVAARERKGWTQAQLAVYAGLSPGVVERAERLTSHDEVERLPVGTLVKLARALDVTAVELYPQLS